MIPPPDGLTPDRGTDGIATIVFVDLEGSTDLVDRLGDHVGGAVVGRQLDVVRDHLAEYGGREVKSLGDGLLLVFGSPRQAVGCGLAIQRALAGTSPQLRIGINAGEVIDSDSDPMGGAVNAAARIVGRADGGEVLVSDVVRLLVGNSPGVRFVDRGRVRLRGFTDRWHLWAASDTTTGPSERATFGRAADLAALREVVAVNVSGTGRTIVMEGEAGIGKTHLVQAAVRMAAQTGTIVVEAIADEVTRRVGVLPHALLAHHAVADEFREPLRELLARSTRRGDVEDLSFAVVEASVDAVESIGTTGPALVVFDDAQWADPLSVAVLRSLARRTSSAHFSLIASLRPSPRSGELDRMIDTAVDAGGLFVRLGPLDQADIQAMSTAITGAAPGEHLRARLSATGGNPLFTTELLRSLEDEGHLIIEAGVAEVPASAVPSGLSETLMRRLSWLPSETRELLRVASLLGTSFTLADVAAVTDRSVLDVAATLREASVAGLIVGDGDRLVFRHDLVRESVYATMFAAERRDLHRAAAGALARSGAPVQQVAAQYGRAALPGDLDAVQWLQRAAAEIIAIAPSTAIDLYEQALALAPDGWDGRGALMAELIEPLAWCGRFDQAEQMAEDVLAISPDDDVVFRALRGLSSVFGNRGEVVDAIATIRRAVAVPGAPADEVARLACLSAQLQLMTGEIDADEAARRATDGLARALERDDATGQCVAHQVLGAVFSVTGFGEAALEHTRHAMALEESGTINRASYLIPDMFYASELAGSDRLDEAIRQGTVGRARYQARGAMSQLPMSYMVTGAAHWYAGRFDDALAELDAGLAVVSDTGSHNFLLYLLALQARIALHRGEIEVATEAIASGFERMANGQPMFGADWLLGAHIEVLWATGDIDGALAGAELMWQETARIRYFYGARERHVCIARLASRYDRPELAESATAALEEGARRRPAGSGVASALQCRGIVNRDSDLLIAAVEKFRTTPLRPAHAVCCEDAAESLVTSPASSLPDSHARDGGGRTLALSLLHEAASIHAELGATADAARVDAAIQQLEGQPVPPRPKRPTFGWEALTPVELAVTELAAEGLSNPEIGRRLFVSRRTVESHLAHIFRKLDLSSRVQLAAEFVRRNQVSR